jgi:multiple sugar transport system ATP-binding protein
VATLDLEHVDKVYPGHIRAVDDLSLAVAEGELIVLVGPSGCGKTTTLRMIAGLEPLTSGTIAIDGHTVNGLAPKDRDVAMVFQHPALYPHLNVARNMAFGLRLRGMAKAETQRRVDQAAELLEIGRLLDRRPGQLSGGQRQRVALGRAIVRRPRLFLFDEPLSNLDAGLRGQMRQHIRRIHARLGTTTVYVTHDQTEAMTLGQRIAVMREGRLQQLADPITLYDRPANRFVAGLIGSPAMNFLAGRIEPHETQLVFSGGGLTLPIPDECCTHLEAYRGHSIVLGIRPEHIGSATAERVEDAPRLSATVEAVEPVGPESYVHLNCAAHTLVQRTDAGCRCRVGERVRPALDVGRLHFFDPETGQSVAASVEVG